MMKNYKKIATGSTYIQNIPIQDDNTATANIPINLSFNPSDIIVFLSGYPQGNGSIEGQAMGLNYANRVNGIIALGKFSSNDYKGNRLFARINSISRTNINIGISGVSHYGRVCSSISLNVFKWIAIE